MCAHACGFDYLVSVICSKNPEFKQFLINLIVLFSADHALSLSAQNAVSRIEAPLSETIGFIQEEKKNDPLSSIP